ncbi:DNA-binding transcriptional regulator, GntR family [Microbacterium azadirachtae]|nr:DNA-binding transcriptional regulator, GntR family [Microbacterium azadirachtae]SEF42853.1 DNA-binding transcriptional regulator, GntR family [Microbacterium azadirachtae]SEF42913.1 DNA-binding transcriptional regulator, GntR family [Microbacterium azadirachtae]
MYTLTLVTIIAEGMRAGEFAYRALLEEIQSGSLPAGTVLGEVEQAERLGVSRTPLREALRRLTADGLVEQLSPRVTVVAAIDADDIRDLFVLRRALEETTARAAAAAPGRDEFGALADRFAEAARSLDDEESRARYYALIARFDEALDAAVGNDYLTAALRTVRTHLVRVRRMAKDKPDRLAASAGEHRLIAEAISSGDGDLAAHATHVHLHNALASILDSLGEAGTHPTTAGKKAGA